MSTTLATPQEIILPAALVKVGEQLVSQVKEIQVTDPASYEVAVSLGRSLKDAKNARLDFFKPIKRAIDASKAAVLEREKAAIAPLDEAIRHLDSVATTWRRAEEARQECERRAAEEEARKKAEADRKREIKAALAKGDKRMAKELEKAPIVTAPVFVPPSVPAAAGARKRKVWKFTITQAAKVPREWCCPDEKAIGAFVRDHGEAAIGKIPGVEVYVEEHTL
jgi:hypothetical protein